jgi:hypothetical protein
MEGLKSVVQARGGYETLENDVMLSRLLFWYDSLRLFLIGIARWVFTTNVLKLKFHTALIFQMPRGKI